MKWGVSSGLTGSESAFSGKVRAKWFADGTGPMDCRLSHWPRSNDRRPGRDRRRSYLAAAIIRESQYDERRSQWWGGWQTQLMPVTANAVAQRYGFPTVGREDLFDQETNIRLRCGIWGY